MKKKNSIISIVLIVILFLLMILTDIAIAMNKWLFVALIGVGIFTIIVFLLKICDKKHSKY